MRSEQYRPTSILAALFVFMLPTNAQARFLQTDPVGYADQLNLYGYVGNDPLNRIDPSGKVIVVEGPTQWEAETFRDINLISSAPKGADFIQQLRDSSAVIRISPLSQARAGNRDLGNQTVATKDTDARNGKGSGSTIYYDTKATTGGTDANGSNQRPSFVGLGHELGHAEDNANGTKTGGYATRAAGTTPPVEQNSVKRENEIRKEHGLPERPSYFPCQGTQCASH